MSDHLIAPHGGALVDLIVDDARAAELKAASADWPSWDLTPRQVCDLELLMNGGFSPLRTFLNQADHESVCTQMRLADGTLWPMPITLDVTEEMASQLSAGVSLALRDLEGVILAVLHVEEIYQPDRQAEAEAVFGTTNPSTPGWTTCSTGRTRTTCRAGWRVCSCRCTTTSACCATRPPSCATSSTGWAGPGWWPSRPATRCTGPTRSSRCGRPRTWRPTSSSTRWWA